MMGVIMVTDADTKPLEFRVTSPIKPTNFQKILYGSVLKEHILVELVALPLLNAINEELDLIFVSDPLFLGANNKQDVRVVRVYSGSQTNSEKYSNVELKSFNGHTDPTYLETTKDLSDELPGISEAVERIIEGRDLVEPFDRLRLASEQVYLKTQKSN
jgi:hypothetical protein